MARRSAPSAGEKLTCLLIYGSPSVRAFRSPSHLRTTLALLNATFRHFLRTDIFSSHTELCLLKLLLENWWRTADTAPLESNIDLYAIGDLDERDAARHAVVFAIKSHGAVETAGGCSFAIARESEFLRFGHAANGEVTLDVKCVWAGLNDFGGFESDQRGFFYVKEILTLQLVVLHMASGVDAIGFNLDV